MLEASGSSCCVCGGRDARALVDVALSGGQQVTVCGSHALTFERHGGSARSVGELRAAVGERRGRRDRREEGDALGAALTAAFGGDKRVLDRRGA